MTKTRALLLIFFTWMYTAVSAEDVLLKSGVEKNRLIELYTSEGCSSCPPADKWISKLKNNDELWSDIFPIAFHVDYWDRLGWKDELARKSFSDRQRQYRHEGSISQVYTPGFVVDGQEWRGFFKRKMLKPVKSEKVGEITLALKHEEINATFIPEIESRDDLIFHTAVLGFDIENKIEAGENAGRTLQHDFAVIAYDNKYVSVDNNTFATTMQLPQSKQDVEVKAIVVWISEPNSQSPLQVVGDWL